MPNIQAGSPYTGATSGEPTTLTISVTVDAGDRRAIIYCFSGEGDGTATQAEISSIVRDGQGATRVRRVERADWSWTEIWRLVAPNVGTANAVVTVTEGDSFGGGAHVLTNVDQAAPIADDDGVSGSAASATLTLTAAAADLLIDSLGIDSTGHNPVPGADQTERWEIDGSTGGFEGASSTQPGTAGGVMSWTWTTSAPYSLAAVVVADDPGGATLSPASLVRARALGTPTVSPQVLPASLVRARALGAPTVIGPVFPASLVRSRALGSPAVSVSGAIAPASLVRARALGAPAVIGPVFPASLVRSRALGSPAVSSTLVVDPPLRTLLGAGV